MDEKTQNDVKRFRSFTTDIETPDDIPPIPNKLPADFYEFACEYYELQLNKCIGSSKSDWDANLQMRFSRWNHINDLIKNESKKHTKFNKNADQTLNAAKKLDEDRKRVAASLCKKDLSLSACVNHLKSMESNRPKRRPNQQVPKPRKINKLNESFM